MTAISIEVRGAAEATSRFRHLYEVVAKPETLTRNLAVILQTQIQENALSGHGQHEGGFPNARTSILAGSFSHRLASPTRAIVGSRLVPHYAPDVEYGHRQKVGRFVAAIGRRLVNSFAPAYPFVAPAVNMARDKIQQFIAWWIEDILKGGTGEP